MLARRMMRRVRRATAPAPVGDFYISGGGTHFFRTRAVGGDIYRVRTDGVGRIRFKAEYGDPVRGLTTYVGATDATAVAVVEGSDRLARYPVPIRDLSEKLDILPSMWFTRLRDGLIALRDRVFVEESYSVNMYAWDGTDIGSVAIPDFLGVAGLTDGSRAVFARVAGSSYRREGNGLGKVDTWAGIVDSLWLDNNMVAGVLEPNAFLSSDSGAFESDTSIFDDPVLAIQTPAGAPPLWHRSVTVRMGHAEDLDGKTYIIVNFSTLALWWNGTSEEVPGEPNYREADLAAWQSVGTALAEVGGSGPVRIRRLLKFSSQANPVGRYAIKLTPSSSWVHLSGQGSSTYTPPPPPPPVKDSFDALSDPWDSLSLIRIAGSRLWLGNGERIFLFDLASMRGPSGPEAPGGANLIDLGREGIIRCHDSYDVSDEVSEDPKHVFESSDGGHTWNIINIADADAEAGAPPEWRIWPEFLADKNLRPA